MHIHKQLYKNQTGIVSIVVTIILMLVISITVLVFARIARREQRQSLDRQLSTSAFYAAESGANDAAHIIDTEVAASRTIPDKTTCKDPVTPNAFSSPNLNYTIDGPTGVGYTCVLVDPTPDTLVYDSISDKGRVILLKSTGGDFKTIDINWTDVAGSTVNNFTTCPTNFPTVANWNNACPVGMLRFDLVNGAPATLTRQGLAQSMHSVFVYPAASGSNYSYDGIAPLYDNQGSVVSATSCTDSATTQASCRVRIRVWIGSKVLFLRFRSLYRTSNITITATDVADNPVSFEGTQVVIDSTGKSNDVLRRVQIHRPLGPVPDLPDFAIETGTSTCKRYLVTGAAALSLGSGDGNLTDNGACAITAP